MDNPSRSYTQGLDSHKADLGFGSVPKAGRNEQQAEGKKKKSELMLEVLVQAGAHKSSTTKERLGVF